MLLTPLKGTATPDEKLLSSILYPVISAAVSPTLESSNQSAVPPVPLELITSVIRRIEPAKLVFAAPQSTEISAKHPKRKDDLVLNTLLTKHINPIFSCDNMMTNRTTL